MLSSTLLSERASIAAKRLIVRLMMGRHILCPVLSGQDVDNALVACRAQSKHHQITTLFIAYMGYFPPLRNF